MSGPWWLSVAFAGVMLAIAAYCAARLAAAGAWRQESELDADGMHLLMGVAMAGALAPPVSILAPGVWELVFAVAAAWFAWQAARAWRGRGAGRWCCPHPAPHLAESVAMVYMLAAGRVPAAGSAHMAMPAMAGTSAVARFPVLAIVLALFMAGYTAWLGDRLISLSRPAAASTLRAEPRRPSVAAALRAARQGRPLAPRAATCYKIAMGVTMAYMLISMT